MTNKAKNLNVKVNQVIPTSLLAFAENKAQVCDYRFNWVTGTPITFSTGMGAANSVNDSGFVLGPRLTGVTSPSGLWSGSVWTALESPTRGIAMGFKLNNACQSSGVIKYSARDIRPTRWDGTTAHELPRLNGFYGQGSDINCKGEVAGFSWAESNFHAVRWDSDNKIHDLGTLGGSFSRASGMNDLGYIVGTSFTANDEAQHATLWKPDGTVVDLDTSGSRYSWAVDINNAGMIAGYTMNENNRTHAQVWYVDGSPTISIEGTWSNPSVDTYILEQVASPINNAGQIVGSLTLYDGTPHFSYAFMWENGDLIDLNNLLSAEDLASGIHLDWASGINDSGAIWGMASQNGLSGAFVLTPASVALPGAALLLNPSNDGLSCVNRKKPLASA
jgi:probable HAF family extracellular repeat protein